MQQKKEMDKHTISYYSKSDGKRLKRPYDPKSDMQYEFTAYLYKKVSLKKY
jgi:hypothetical protein